MIHIIKYNVYYLLNIKVIDMLMSFSVDNFRSICKEQKLSFVSDKQQN